MSHDLALLEVLLNCQRSIGMKVWWSLENARLRDQLSIVRLFPRLRDHETLPIVNFTVKCTTSLRRVNGNVLVAAPAWVEIVEADPHLAPVPPWIPNMKHLLAVSAPHD